MKCRVRDNPCVETKDAFQDRPDCACGPRRPIRRRHASVECPDPGSVSLTDDQLLAGSGSARAIVHASWSAFGPQLEAGCVAPTNAREDGRNNGRRERGVFHVVTPACSMQGRGGRLSRFWPGGIPFRSARAISRRETGRVCGPCESHHHREAAWDAAPSCHSETCPPRPRDQKARACVQNV